jgi:molybdate transport system substrate-binding protein
MNELAERIIPETRVDLLENKVVLAVPDGNPAEISSFDDLMDRLQAGTVRLSVGNSDVPVGQYTQKIFDYFGMDEGDMGGGVSYCTSAKQVTAQVTEAVVDCGILYATDVNSAGLTVVDTALAEHCGQVLYPAALLQGADMDAQYFLHYLQGDIAEEFFVQMGFTHLDEY